MTKRLSRSKTTVSMKKACHSHHHGLACTICDNCFIAISAASPCPACVGEHVERFGRGRIAPMHPLLQPRDGRSVRWFSTELMTASPTAAAEIAVRLNSPEAFLTRSGGSVRAQWCCRHHREHHADAAQDLRDQKFVEVVVLGDPRICQEPSAKNDERWR